MQNQPTLSVHYYQHRVDNCGAWPVSRGVNCRRCTPCEVDLTYHASYGVHFPTWPERSGNTGGPTEPQRRQARASHSRRGI